MYRKSETGEKLRGKSGEMGGATACEVDVTLSEGQREGGGLGGNVLDNPESGKAVWGSLNPSCLGEETRVSQE